MERNALAMVVPSIADTDSGIFLLRELGCQPKGTTMSVE
jgi:hypothetical protein